MYETYFGLSERPFSIAPDPQYLYMSTRHKEAMAHLSYGLSQGGCFIVLTGEVGTGKTTLCRNLLSDLPGNVDVALILNANITEDELLQTICDELKIDYQDSQSQKQLLDTINHHLLDTFANNRHTVLIIDEAQLLSRDVLEKIRLLTNLETTKNKLLQIILIGQPELNDVLARNDLRQLAQRVTARYHLGALERGEIEDYVNYRLSVAGCKQPLFSRQALNSMHSTTSGIPRKINVLADHSLLATYSKNQSLVDAKTVKQAARDVFINSTPAELPTTWFKSWWSIAALILVINLGLWWWFIQKDVSSPALSPQPVSSSQSASSPQPSAQALNPQTSQVTQPQADVSGELENLAQDASQSTTQIEVPSNTPVAIKSSSNVDVDELVVIETDASILPGSVLVSEEYLDTPAPITSSVQATKSASLDPAFSSALETSADITGRITSFKKLASLWQVTLSGPLLNPICTELAEQGLSCMLVTSWQQLEKLNRPAVIVLKHNEQLHRVILQSIENNNAFVLIGDSVRETSVEALRAQWIEQAMVFWRPQTFGEPFIQLGSQSQQLPEIRAYLNQALARSEMPLLKSIDSDVFDLDLSQKVFALQTRFGITPDSKIGNETYMLMNEIIDPENTLVLKNRFINR